ncbi:TrmH family RNA methyltransferase [Paraliobacillus ryukyuensis]|uniref:TrmH family RNA methyltransferase n=1 Tax=Paraliobacillus ryukyuensis TaxID=200904 RepID=UPI0009A68A6F|nr:RNA methyltransferase [Paraliobacillus ryukyuensis]
MITSVKNETIKQWKKLKQKKYRDQAQQFLVEGAHLVEEAINSQHTVEKIIIQTGVESMIDLKDIAVVTVSDNVMEHLADTKSPQGIMAVVHMKERTLASKNRLLLLDAIQDPGNVGTMIRTADAAGFSGIILGAETADLYNEKVIRASQGSIFHLPIVQSDLALAVEDLKQQGVSIWASTLEQAEPINQLDVSEKIALIVGNEGAGVSASLLQQSDQRVHIPIYGQAESLNVSVATGIMLYQIVSN